MPAKIVGRTEKQCSRCKLLLPMTAFTTSPSRPSGASRCVRCATELAAVRREEQPELQKAARARWSEKHPEQFAAMRSSHSAAYYEAHSTALKIKVLEWQKAHPELVRIYKKMNRHRRRAAINGARVPARFVIRLFESFEGRCAYCRDRPAAHIDHIYPLSKGGSHAVENLAPACAKCNLSKGSSLPAAFQTKTGYDVQAVIKQVAHLSFD